MTLDEAKKYYGTYVAIADALKVTPQAIQFWKKNRHIPFMHQLNLERLTEGELMADDENRNSKFYKARIIKQQQKGD